MLKTKFFTQLLYAFIGLIALTILGQPVVQAQQSVFLLRGRCADGGPGNWGRNNLNVSIGRSVYTSLFYMGPGDRSASFACRIRPADDRALFQSLRLGFGMRDQDKSSPSNIVNVYLDGQQVGSQQVSAGQPEMFFLDVSNATNVAIETVCSRPGQYCDRVYFFEAVLEPLPRSN